MLSATVESLNKKCKDQEACSRWNNICFVGLPEGVKGPCPKDFVAQRLQDLLNLKAKPMLDRAQCMLRAKLKEGEPLQPLIVRVSQFQTRNHILHSAGEASPLVYNQSRVYIFLDFTPTVAKQWMAFVRVKRELYSCPNVKFGLCYPATLHIILPNA